MRKKTSPRDRAEFSASNGYVSPAELGFRIRWLRERLKLSLRDVEEQTGINAATLCRWENGKAFEGSLGTFIKLSAALQTTASELLKTSDT